MGCHFVSYGHYFVKHNQIFECIPSIIFTANIKYMFGLRSDIKAADADG